MRGLFIIQEIARGTANLPDAERFEWTADTVMPDSAKGGARACPRQPWSQPAEMRRKRMDYPGTRRATHQVSGARQKEHSYDGTWLDRWNFPGYALAEQRRFIAMAERGRLVRVQYLSQAFEGIIGDWNFDYRRDWDIGYHFTLDVQARVDTGTSQALSAALRAAATTANSAVNRSPPTTLGPAQLFDRADTAVQSVLQVHAGIPRVALAGDLADVVDAALGSVAGARDLASATMDERESAPTRGLDQVGRLATQLRQVEDSARDAAAALGSARADLSLVTSVPSAIAVLDFEDWSRGVRTTCRQLASVAAQAADALDERARAAPARLYRPSKGESLYAISRRFYGTPHAWRTIADRNDLITLTLAGTELLVIPERGGA